MNQINKPKIGIAFSGGGARGIAHVGVLKALLENGIEPQVISGSSAGSIVGALYAAGKSPEEMLAFVKDSKLFKLIKVGLPNRGFTKLTYLRERLAQTITEDSFEALNKKLIVAISNLHTGVCEMVSSGPLFDVIVASSSIPLVFKPVELKGQLYVDGGLLSNLPAIPLLEEVDFVIGVNVMPQVELRDTSLQSLIGVAARCFELSVVGNTRADLEQCHFVIEPKAVHRYHIFQFNQYEALYQIGHEATQEIIPALMSQLNEMKK
ncbi:MAG: patatin-like phospholipase family protein [Saprospiraceae bacterium]|nr:patatin-like phospholipase family protein [Saprospiraceae bacterium]